MEKTFKNIFIYVCTVCINIYVCLCVNMYVDIYMRIHNDSVIDVWSMSSLKKLSKYCINLIIKYNLLRSKKETFLIKKICT